MYVLEVDKNGWVTGQRQAKSLKSTEKSVDKSTYDKVDSADPSNEQEAWHWNNGNPELRETGAPPSGDEAYAEMEKYLRDKYTLNEWANMMDANPILIELIKNEEYQNAVNRADYLANDDNSLVDSEDADKLREVTNV